MPLITIHLTECLPEKGKAEAIAKAVDIVAEETGKPASVVMVRLLENTEIHLGGQAGNAALFEVKGIELAAAKTQALTTRLCAWATDELSTPGERVFVICDDVTRGRWGFDGKVF